jgi:hypothetical protein
MPGPSEQLRGVPRDGNPQQAVVDLLKESKIRDRNPQSPKYTSRFVFGAAIRVVESFRGEDVTNANALHFIVAALS